ncbi:MAG: trpF [Acidobacteria bacterium]|nr:trpF [Acidobacteriota bacterium]
MRVRVKICGITSYNDAVLALDLGADALGFNFFPGSPRCLDAAAAREITRRLPPLVTTVGVFVNVPDPDEAAQQARAAGVQVLQLHGDESAEYCRRLADFPVIKALRIGRAPDLQSLRDFPAQMFLFDVRDEQRYGGTGRAFDWLLVRPAALEFRILVAGGLHPSNVAEMIRDVRPFGVDVCSGVESRPGRKDAAKLAAFMNEVWNANSE